MITYADGVEARTGDRVDLDGEPAVVEALIDSADQQAEWGLSERGLMFKCASMGLVFEAVDSSTWDAIVFVGRGT